MATLSYASLVDTALPSLWDGDELTKIRLQDGRTFEELQAEIQMALAMLNANMLNMSIYGDMVAVQDDAEYEYAIGDSNAVEVMGEYSPPTPRRGATTGHMIPLVPYTRAMGWTWRYLTKARVVTLDADIASGVKDMKNNWQKQLLTRFFKVEGETVGSTSNASVPFADGGDTDSSYIPPQSPEGETFDATHDHFLRQASISDTNVAAALEHIQEHGHMSPFDIIASRADAASWTALTGWKSPEWPGIMYHSSGVERAEIAEVSPYYGYVETEYGIARVWLTPRVPTNYYGVFKSYGPGDPRNPLRVRIDMSTGFGWRLVPGQWANMPTQIAVAFAEYGVGVGDRTNGVCVEIDSSGDYATPTIS